MLKSVLLISNVHGELAVAGPKLSQLSNLLPRDTRTIFLAEKTMRARRIVDSEPMALLSEIS